MFSDYFIDLIKSTSYLGLFLIIFAESGLLIGFFLPGDSLLFTAGFLAAQDFLSLPVLVITCFIAAIIGDGVGYACGIRFGKKLFCKKDSFLFHKNNLLKAQAFYEKHGGKAIILARFVPIIRTFAPIIAGIGTMPYKKFLIYNIVGGILWAMGLPITGYYLGKVIPNIDHYLLPIIIAIILISLSPALFHALKDKETRNALIAFILRNKTKPANTLDD
ncbi:MAG: VTT domain-containing protein [Chlamydiales bacterium]|nr:VTT domain-containing protein [Chlamydiales bacterium]